MLLSEKSLAVTIISYSWARLKFKDMVDPKRPIIFISQTIFSITISELQFPTKCFVNVETHTGQMWWCYMTLGCKGIKK